MDTDDDRASSKHGPRLDDLMAKEVKGEARVEPWREPEPAADGEPDASWVPQGHHGFDSGDDRDPDRREERARIGGYLPRDVFPAGRARLLQAAQENHATDEVIEILSQLPPDVEYPNHREFWKALDLLSDR
jgi:hypothetical protein